MNWQRVITAVALTCVYIDAQAIKGQSSGELGVGTVVVLVLVVLVVVG